MATRKKYYRELIESIPSVAEGVAAKSGIEIVEECCNILSPILFDYQVEACKSTAMRMLKTKEPLLIQMATGGGKSWVIVGLSYIIKRLSINNGKDKKVLMICPSPELVKQNVEKLREVGFEPTIYCNKLREKSVEGDIIVGTPISILNALSEFTALEFSGFYLDEAQHHTPKTIQIVNELKKHNPNLREVGLSATPHRRLTGYIYRHCNILGRDMTEEEASEPYYAEKVYELKADVLISMGRLVPPVFEKVGLQYETENLVLEKDGWNKKTEKEVFFNGKNQLNATIVKDIIKRTKKRKSVLVFAQNIAHAKMIASSFGNIAGITHSNMDQDIRDSFITQFKQGKLKYLINVASLTTGFDSPITDTVVFLRATESAGLFEQILGRGLRINPDKRARKTDCLILDYAKNYERHCPHGDPFNPNISVTKLLERDVVMIDVTCPTCFKSNRFMSGMHVVNGTIDEYGYLCSEITGQLVMTRSAQPMPIAGHRGSQCLHYEMNSETGINERCTQKWSRNYCSHCGYLNSNAESFCIRCETPLSQSAYEINEVMLGTTAFGHMQLGERYGEVEEYNWVPRTDKHGKPILLLAVTCKESPSLKISYNEDKGKKVYEVVEPKKYKLSFWLSPNSMVEEAINGWKAFGLFFFDEEISFDDIERLEKVRDLRYLSYGYQDNGQFLRVLKYLDGCCS